ncbi:MAG: hypothetical protein A2Y62_15135 [Candidatus Fischerbacteria bacterium RBG_13_37_8]|uniref:Uncharacterized protein n=1 Tax=Candidatus Fischerbacteria bacterium RBG_13_37_8 TaxID=1817863 RepID=A0A1F5VNR9_9BACT|nr:MAG: hypothetical protein A2Y62_15135 [Candidatus Fischerbacteria bacterium RBG_13_37_8]
MLNFLFRGFYSFLHNHFSSFFSLTYYTHDFSTFSQRASPEFEEFLWFCLCKHSEGKLEENSLLYLSFIYNKIQKIINILKVNV